MEIYYCGESLVLHFYDISNMGYNIGPKVYG